MSTLFRGLSNKIRLWEKTRNILDASTEKGLTLRMPKGTRAYKLTASVSADTNAAASIIIQQTGWITAILGIVRQTGTIADGDAARAELSFASTSNLGTNDSVGPIFQVENEASLVTSGMAQVATQQDITGIMIPVSSGDRLFVNIDITGTTTCTVTFYVYVLS